MKQLIILAILMAAILMVSCNKNDNQATGVGDVLIVAKQSGANTVYGISMYAYSLSPFASVSTVSSADPGKTFILKANQGYKTSFYYETPDNQFTTTKPAVATFTFSAIFENRVTQEFQNTLTDKVLPIPTFIKCEYNIVDRRLDVKWTLINGASSYSLSIFDGSTLVFGSAELKKSDGTYSINATGGGWAVGFKPENGKTYTVHLFAYLYEPGGGVYNIQATSIAEKTVVWGN